MSLVNRIYPMETFGGLSLHDASRFDILLDATAFKNLFRPSKHVFRCRGIKSN